MRARSNGAEERSAQEFFIHINLHFNNLPRIQAGEASYFVRDCTIALNLIAIVCHRGTPLGPRLSYPFFCGYALALAENEVFNGA